jgi:hypothetical protein
LDITERRGMIFRIGKQGGIESYRSSWLPKELELERYIVPRPDAEEPLLEESVFGEPLLLLSNQVRTRQSKRADILALDQAGNSVIVELKRRAGSLGVETQALQYLADFSVFKGRDFLLRFTKGGDALEDKILGFLGGDVKVEDINRRSRIILIAQSFDRSLFSMGEWLSRANIAFRCIEYTPFEIGDQRFLSFSVAFDRAPDFLYPLAFQNRARQPTHFWHNIGGRADEGWWDFLKKQGEISTGFENQPGDEGERILKSYIAGDTIIAYAKSFGAVGWGLIERPTSYRLIQPGDPADRLGGKHLHRLSIRWKAVASTLRDGIRPEEIRERFDIYHPVSTSVKIDDRKAQRLVLALTEKFNPS